MDSNDLNHRINRIYAALEGVKEEDLTKFPPKIAVEGDRVQVWQDFRGDVGDAELENAAYSLINNIVNLPNHLQRWAAKNNKDKGIVDSVLNKSQAFQILVDLANAEEHGPPRNNNETRSRLAPRVAQFCRRLRLSTGPEAGCLVKVILTPQGPKQVAGTGTASVVITGNVVDADGNAVADLFALELQAIEQIEKLFESLQLQRDHAAPD